jgi:hypothetical protein
MAYGRCGRLGHLPPNIHIRRWGEWTYNFASVGLRLNTICRLDELCWPYHCECSYRLMRRCLNANACQFIFAASPASGGHLNPTITLATFFAGLCTLPRAVLYIVAQCAGAIVGCYWLRLGLGDEYYFPSVRMSSSLLLHGLILLGCDTRLHC